MKSGEEITKTDEGRRREGESIRKRRKGESVGKRRKDESIGKRK